jgi:hypothetical protein
LEVEILADFSEISALKSISRDNSDGGFSSAFSNSAEISAQLVATSVFNLFLAVLRKFQRIL